MVTPSWIDSNKHKLIRKLIYHSDFTTETFFQRILQFLRQNHITFTKMPLLQIMNRFKRIVTDIVSYDEFNNWIWESTLTFRLKNRTLTAKFSCCSAHTSSLLARDTSHHISLGRLYLQQFKQIHNHLLHLMNYTICFLTARTFILAFCLHPPPPTPLPRMCSSFPCNIL
jgi:hypothetical protein